MATALAAMKGQAHVSDCLLRLYIAGRSAISQRAESHLRQLHRSIKLECNIEIIDVLKSPELAEQAGVLATPTLSYEHPSRSRRIIGDLSDTKRIVEFLGIELKEQT
ncbi:circadian clock KaiB family protein [Rhodoplanes sp. Z2-YC6860]|uniref:circadian clock KaiB family protein n=1 Tax=Rhodoplanes sp. Z2-YC6860 TaxID=674703 RepID=UPI0012ED8163|nr:circadian clock KaiB family protein [Rhodoplanes sp. Z2-YC6860]